MGSVPCEPQGQGQGQGHLAFRELQLHREERAPRKFGGSKPIHPGLLGSSVTSLVLDGSWGHRTPCAVVARVTESRWLSQPL